MRRWALFVPAIVAGVVLAIVSATTNLAAAPRWIALGCAVMSIGAAAAIRKRELRVGAAMAGAIFAVTVAGLTRAGLPYVVAALTFPIVVAASVRADRPRVAAEGRAPAEARALRVLLLVAVVVAGGLIVGLPRLSALVEGRVIAFLIALRHDGGGFPGHIDLGSTRGMPVGDAVVMRVHGAKVRYLRGAIYDEYAGGRWSSALGEDRRELSAEAPLDEAPTRIEIARGATVTSGRRARWFLPEGACDVGTRSGRIEVDVTGLAHPAQDDDAREIGLRPGGVCAPMRPILPPRSVELQLPRRLSEKLAPILAEWTRGAATDRDKLVAIERRLTGFRYSLAVERDPALDPVVDLLTVHREGHCEYFAAAMALLARTAGIPSRVVGGYSVSEENPLADYAVVRDRNAHAWVEAWVDGAWTTFDPTPAVEIEARARSSRLDDVLDLLSWRVDRAFALLARIGVVRLSLGAVTLLALLVAALRLARRVRRARGVPRVATTRPLPCFEALERTLADAGHPRDLAEPVETFARRLAASGEPWAPGVADALLRYARLRYGGIGEEGEVTRVADAVAATITRRTPP